MEPKLPMSNLGPERSSIHYEQNLEQKPNFSQPEVAPERLDNDRLERQGESSATSITQTPSLPLTIAPPLTTSASDDKTLQPMAADAPLVANDDDLIEKEWVDKAKKIIAETKDDPYRREKEVGHLQADYLLKRYGKELGTPQ